MAEGERINIRDYMLLFGVISCKTVQVCSCNDHNLRNHGNVRARALYWQNNFPTGTLFVANVLRAAKKLFCV